ncbi:MAG TPA: helix-turn-helix domain-containing protein [Thermoanaerobaculia bacterium]|jgi:transcriptional regulator with XRE-family HTH domain|nr:helix-turn-helix domain-containing protein [Thermoanaerobaculia bacterium]
MSQEKDEVRRVLDVLQTLMRMLAVSNREVERRLELQHGTVSRLLNGQIEAKLETVLGVARALGLEYEELFAIAYPGRPVPAPESDAARKIRAMLEDLRPQPAKAKAQVDPAELFHDVKRAVREIMEERAMESGPKAGNGGR